MKPSVRVFLGYWLALMMLGIVAYIFGDLLFAVVDNLLRSANGIRTLKMLLGATTSIVGMGFIYFGIKLFATKHNILLAGVLALIGGPLMYFGLKLALTTLSGG